MRRSANGLVAAAGAAVALAGCQSMQQTSASTADIAARSGKAAGSAAADTYQGVGEAASTPLHDLNLMQDRMPPILIHAYAHPYDRTGLDTCPAIADEIHQLDLALGPDVDIPQSTTTEGDMFQKGASVAADAALDAVRSATGGVIPIRSWVRRMSGAVRAEQEAKAVALAGSVRRGYLKALGESKDCNWPASPLPPQIYRAKLAALNAAAATQKASGEDAGSAPKP
jgi:hypothetical protein